ncbi:MAG: hypothetical protein PWR10_2334 [Halanaerobiales bacterium]|nr:hypothetical protein [Halanaerobiales bacterium]
MPDQLQISEVIARRTVETKVVRNVAIPTRLPPAERVVSVNARVEITDVNLETGYVVFSGIIRSTIFYASAEDPSNVISIRRSFNFTDRVAVRGARRGLEADIVASISDINFYLINDRLIGVEFVVTSDIEITAPEVVKFIEERPGIEIERERFRIRHQLQEREFTRELRDVERLPTEAPDIRRIISLEASPQIVDITTDYDRVIVRGVINNNLLYVNTQGTVEFVNLQFPFTESFIFRGVTPKMSPFVDITITEEEAERVDNRRVRKTIGANFRILVIREEVVEIPIEIVTRDRFFPIRRTVLVERVVAEKRTRILERDQITIPEENPDISRVIRATGMVRGGSVSAETTSGGVIINGIVDVNIIYVADLPQQPVYFTSGSITFSSFIDIPEVTAEMDAIADVSVDRVTAERIDERRISVRAIMDVNLLVTEVVRVPIITGVTERPIEVVEEEGFFTYTVRPGDTLYLIAQRYGVSVERLIEINNIADPRQLQVGQQILIPRG